MSERLADIMDLPDSEKPETGAEAILETESEPVVRYSQRLQSRKRFAYTLNFKEFVHAHPKMIAAFKKLESEVALAQHNHTARLGDVFKSEDVRITLINNTGTTDFSMNNPGIYMKVDASGESFFVKRIYGYHPNKEWSLGVAEFESMQKAKEALKGLPKVEVVDFQIGYENGRDSTYFVSKWIEDGILLREYFKESDLNEDERQKLIMRYRAIKYRLTAKHSFIDVGEHNIIYVPDTDMLFVFDVHAS